MSCLDISEYAAFQALFVYVQLDQYYFVFVILIQWLQLKKLQVRGQSQYYGNEVLTFHLYPDVYPPTARKIQTREFPSTFRHKPSTPPTEYRPVFLIFAALSADSSLDFFGISLFTP